MNNIHYNPETGKFTWLNTKGRAKAGCEAGYLDTRGYRNLSLNNKLYKAHRLAFYLMTGTHPENEIDHINGKRDDNRWSNLRQANRAENMQNVAKRRTASSKYAGVCWNKARSKWHAICNVNGQQHHLGYFDDEQEAAQVAAEAKKKYHTFSPMARGE